MSYRPLPEIHENLDDLEAALRQERNPNLKRSLHLLVLIKTARPSSIALPRLKTVLGG